jgi:hypothetical protein
VAVPPPLSQTGVIYFARSSSADCSTRKLLGNERLKPESNLCFRLSQLPLKVGSKKLPRFDGPGVPNAGPFLWRKVLLNCELRHYRFGQPGTIVPSMASFEAIFLAMTAPAIHRFGKISLN